MKTFKESIIDIPRRTYAPGVFDDADTENPKLKSKVLDMINKQLDEFEKYHPIKKYSLIGSILTKRYRDDADLDINVLFDIPESERENALEALRKNLKNVNGKEVPGTKHPVNYFVIADPKLKEKNDSMADAIFDIKANKFIRRPEKETFDKNKYEKDFQKRVQEIDIVKGELVRDIIDYKELSGLTTNDVLDLQELIAGKLEEIEDAIETIIKIGDKTIEDRRDAFANDMSPDEIREFGKKHKLPKNVIYKMLEKYHYLKFYKKCKEVLDDGKVSDDEIKSLQKEALNDGNTIAFTFGRFNPPTIGHEKLINKVKSIRADEYRIYLSRSNDPKKNPLSPNDKLKIMKKMFPQHARNILINKTNMILDICTELYNQGFTKINMVVGSDRVREFDTIIKKYNGVKSRHGLYDFDDIKIVSAGERDPDAEGATGMSASKMRAAAEKGDLDSFKKGLPRNADAEGIMKLVRKGMNLKDNYIYMRKRSPIVSMEKFEQQQIRDLYIREMIFNIGDTVDYVKEDVQGKVVRKGTNYIVVEDNNNNLHKAWIWDCIPIAADREVEVREYNLDVDYGFEAVSEASKAHTDRLAQDKDVKDKKGTQPKKYYSGLKKDVKDKRASHFKGKDTTKNDNTPAPGDKTAKTRPSKHTQKFKKMFGELQVDLKDACWTGYKQVGMKKKGNKQVPNCVPETTEAYEIGHDYANHTKEITPGEKPFMKPVDVKKRGTPDDPKSIGPNDVKEWAARADVIDKYRERYKENFKAKLDEVVAKMMEKL